MAFFHRFLPLLLTQSMLFTVATRARHENRESMFPRVLARHLPGVEGRRMVSVFPLGA